MLYVRLSEWFSGCENVPLKSFSRDKRIIRRRFVLIKRFTRDKRYSSGFKLMRMMDNINFNI